MMHTEDQRTPLDDFDEQRPALFALAYRMLGSVMDAEDVIQEAFLRWQQAPLDTIASPKAYLLTIVSRLCIDELRKARARRESYVGPWLPEPLVQPETSDPDEAIDLAESLSFAFLLLLERLTPLERAVLVLHDVFGYTYDEAGQMIGARPVHCRQLGHRARQRIAAGPARFSAAPAQVERATREFIRACTEGDMHGLLALFASEITFWSDGGGKVAAARNPIRGADRVARLHLSIMCKASSPMTFGVARVNGRMGIVGFLAGRLNRVYTFDLDDDGQIRALYCVLNPDKLRGVLFDPPQM